MSHVFPGWARLFAVAAAVAWLPNAVYAEVARFNVDLDHSIVGFDVAHMVVSRTTGRFTELSGSVVMDPDTKEVKSIDAVIQTASVTTNHKKRDDHLKSPDFFHVAKHPTMTYKMKRYTKAGDQYTAIGDLTLLGVTKEMTLTGTFNGAVADPYGNTRVGFSGEGVINRKDFGMQWTKTLDKGGLVVGDTVKIKLEIEAIQEKPSK
ncbi:MAG: YceI family protein [Nitrospirota bacterium]